MNATKSGHFRPEKFEDRYEQALKDLIKRKAGGEEIERPKPQREGKVINLMEALRASVDAAGGKGKAERRGAAERRLQPAGHSARRATPKRRKAG